jgi:hypothetical protein
LLRIGLWLSALALCLVPVSAHAGTQMSGGTRPLVVTSPAGYQFQVPGDWQQLPASSQQHMGNVLVQMDGAVASADGSQQAHVEAVTGSGIGSGDLQNVLSSFFAGPPGAPAGAGPQPTPLDAIASVQVPGADAAVGGSMQYTDPTGAARVIAARMVLRGQTTYLFAVDVTQAFYQSDPSFKSIMSSFQLTPPAVASGG